MKRIHFFEFEDQRWFPTFLRNYLTDFLQFLSNKTFIFQGIVPIIQKGLEKSEGNQIIDLASGGGGGMIRINEELLKTNPNLKILFSDFYPNLAAFEHTKQQAPNCDFISSPVDARAVPPNLKGLRTQFLSFHHFRKEDASKILLNAVTCNAPIAIFEAQERSFSSILAMLFSPISVLFTTPFIKPFSLGRIVFTYLIPLVPLFVCFDGVVSSLRTYSVDELKDLVANLPESEKFEWEIDRIKSGPATIIYLLGYPKNTNKL